MPDSQPLDIRNRAIVAFCICTGIRIAALIAEVATLTPVAFRAQII
jgi:hypothetical protein